MLRLFYTVCRWLETLLDGGDLDRRIAEAEQLCRVEAQQEVSEPAEPLWMSVEDWLRGVAFAYEPFYGEDK